jgi:putative membrane protein
MNATQVLSEQQVQRIEKAIADAESTSAAEIVCAVATESGRYDRAEAIVGLIGGLLGLGLAHLFHQNIIIGAGEWSAEALAFGWQALAVALGFVAGHLLASYVHPLRRLFVGEREIDQEVQKGAWHIFATAALRGTVAQTGLLIYVSLFERRVVILADRNARQALGDERIDELRDQAVAQLRSGQFAESFIAAIESAGHDFAEKLPGERSVNPNELDDHVLCYHPRPDVAG